MNIKLKYVFPRKTWEQGKDVSFEEDHSRIRTKQAPFIATMLRSIAINLFNINKFRNIKQARKELGWNSYKIFSLNSKIN